MSDLLPDETPQQINEVEPDNGQDMASFSASAQQEKFMSGASGASIATDEAKEQPPTSTNWVTKLIAERFSSPELWGHSRIVTPHFGLVDARDEWGDVVGSEKVIGNESEVWLAGIYGMRIIPDRDASTKGAVKLDATDLHTVTKIHQALSETVFHDEDIRIATPTKSPNPEGDVVDPMNNNFWLLMIKDGKWPIMYDPRAESFGELEYSSHDYSGYHLGNLATFPKEVQNLITDAATYELAWRSQFKNDDLEKNKIKLLNGESEFDRDPFASGFRGTEDHTNGINKIDNLSDTEYYFPLLAYVSDVSTGNPEERLASIIEYIDTNGEEDDSDLRYEAAQGLVEMKKLIADVVNFNTRHQENRNTTQEEVDEAFEKFKTGLVRVAHKIRGDATSSTESYSISDESDV